ncbi:hypothetical protein [Candidatus Viridilinea mediisalina]|uniref:hypothetical protein n=1 Tax=Candidatus Viridilinea mediisalina TaxID=2024553 RepID=UPI00157FA061|nr:hypothetical protein [Candidatus Viridilinea mediisalina]
MSKHATIGYRDELLPDQSVHRTFDDGSYEWRRQLPDGRVEWQDSRGLAGVDELLGNRLIKRTLANGKVIYGRDQGYGRTAWVSGTSRMVTINQTAFGGQVGAALLAAGAGFMLGPIMWPPEHLTPEEEEQMRQALHNQTLSDGGGGGLEFGFGGPYHSTSSGADRSSAQDEDAWAEAEGDGDGDFG